MILTTSTFTGTIPYVPPPTPQAPTFTMPDPISYEFQVVEYVQDDKITKVALQVKQNTHDQYGNIKMFGTWQDVPRVQVNL
jgi:hypothetical protein